MSATASESPQVSVLRVRDLRTHFDTPAGTVKSVDGVSFHITPGETLAIVGESGSGKSVTALSLMGLIAKPGRIVSGEIDFKGKSGRTVNLAEASEPEMRRVRGNDIGMIFQEPMTALNPVFTVGDQIAEAIVLHRGLRARQASAEAADLLAAVGIPDASRRLRDYPHHLSGGTRQRVVIAMAICCNPSLLIADEPTTALDVTVQAQILDLLQRLQETTGMAIMFITHNLGVVAEIANRVIVMYAGQVIEATTAEQLFNRSRHPYTLGLLRSMPQPIAADSIDHRTTKAELTSIPGSVPSLIDPPPACRFEPRCSLSVEPCRIVPPSLALVGDTHLSRCIRANEL